MSKKNYNDGTTLNTRAYNWSIVIYEITKEYLEERLKELINNGIVKHYSYIIHDKDKEEKDGVMIDKPLHTHILMSFNQNVSIKVIKVRLLKYTEHNMFGQPLKDKYVAYRYLTHKDDKDKYQYDDKDIINYDDFFSKYDPSTELGQSKEYQEINQMIDDYTKLSYRQQACKYGRDYIKNFKSYAYFFEMVIEQEIKQKEKK